jgi:chemotaxis protein histidine kinase CheA/CheY-like chemotaxis protein
MNRSDEISLKDLFLDESQKRLETLFEAIDSLKSKGEGLDQIKTTLHTVKGSANMMGLKEAADTVHMAEELVAEISDSNSPRIPDLEALLSLLSQQLGLSEQDDTEEQRQSFDASKHQNGNSMPIFQKLLSTVANLEILVRDSESKQDSQLSLEMNRLKTFAFRTIFVPTDRLFLGLGSVVDSVSASQGKQVKLVCRSSADQILREYLSELRGALVHLVSNGVVHGIESPQTREREGKERQGLLTVELFQNDEDICLEVRDDGRGVDLESLKRSSEEGIWDSLTPAGKLNLLFEHGRSLRTETDIHAGRGIGLAAVRESVQRLGGRVYFVPVEEGTCLRIELPSPFFLSRCLIVRSCGRLFGLASSSISKVQTSDSDESRFLSVGESLGYSGVESEGSRYEIVCKRGLSQDESEDDKTFSVEECRGLAEVLGYALPKVSGLSPAAFGFSTYQGKPIFLLDLEDLTRRSSTPRSPKDSSRKTTRKRLLVVDDSLATRSILVDVLRRSGYEVDEAVDGKEARALVQQGSYALIVSDLEMPNMTGIELLEWLRSDESPQPGLPFILFTSRDDFDSFQTARLLGADRCLGKSDFSEVRFLRDIERLL